jgi:hypothetical protein
MMVMVSFAAQAGRWEKRPVVMGDLIVFSAACQRNPHHGSHVRCYGLGLSRQIQPVMPD